MLRVLQAKVSTLGASYYKTDYPIYQTALSRAITFSDNPHG
jgi:hypothetical protein